MAKEQIDALYPKVKSDMLDGHTDQYPRYTTDYNDPKETVVSEVP